MAAATQTVNDVQQSAASKSAPDADAIPIAAQEMDCDLEAVKPWFFPQLTEHLRQVFDLDSLDESLFEYITILLNDKLTRSSLSGDLAEFLPPQKLDSFIEWIFNTLAPHNRAAQSKPMATNDLTDKVAPAPSPVTSPVASPAAAFAPTVVPHSTVVKHNATHAQPNGRSGTLNRTHTSNRSRSRERDRSIHRPDQAHSRRDRSPCNGRFADDQFASRRRDHDNRSPMHPPRGQYERNRYDDDDRRQPREPMQSRRHEVLLRSSTDRSDSRPRHCVQLADRSTRTHPEDDRRIDRSKRRRYDNDYESDRRERFEHEPMQNSAPIKSRFVVKRASRVHAEVEPIVSLPDIELDVEPPKNNFQALQTQSPPKAVDQQPPTALNANAAEFKPQAATDSNADATPVTATETVLQPSKKRKVEKKARVPTLSPDTALLALLPTAGSVPFNRVNAVHVPSAASTLTRFTAPISDAATATASASVAASVPVDILKAKTRCHFYPNCTKPHCPYAHPSKPCTAFPRCPFGQTCLFLHPPCKFNHRCARSNCPAQHYPDTTNGAARRPSAHTVPQSAQSSVNDAANPFARASTISNGAVTACRFGLQCTRHDCHFAHPPGHASNQRRNSQLQQKLDPRYLPFSSQQSHAPLMPAALSPHASASATRASQAQAHDSQVEALTLTMRREEAEFKLRQAKAALALAIQRKQNREHPNGLTAADSPPNAQPASQPHSLLVSPRSDAFESETSHHIII